jgi:hypothetical protein
MEKACVSGIAWEIPIIIDVLFATTPLKVEHLIIRRDNV